jgi:hypothetical protein
VYALDYEDLMIKEFMAIADSVKIDIPGFIFSSPVECLEHFISVVENTVTNNRTLTQSIAEIQKEIKIIKEKSEGN